MLLEQEDNQTELRRLEKIAGRLKRLQNVTAALSKAYTPGEVANIIIEQGVAALEAVAGIVVLLTGDKTLLNIVASIGYPPEVVQNWLQIDLKMPVPIADAVRENRVILLHSLEERAERYPELVKTDPNPSVKALVALPLTAEDQVFGAVGLSFASSREFPTDEQEFMQALVQQCAIALERSRLYEAERKAREEAELNQARQTYLAQAGFALSQSLDEEAILRTLTELAVPTVADWCSVYLLEEDENGNYKDELKLVGVSHSDPAKLETAIKFRTRYPLRLSEPGSVPQVIDTGQTLMVNITPAMIEAGAQDNEQLAMLRTLNLTSTMIVPLVARGRSLGVIVYAVARPGHYYNADDKMIGEELARRAAISVENAKSYKAAQQALVAQQELDKQRDRFISIASHELRTPLTSIRGFAQIIRNRLIKRLQVESNPDFERDLRSVNNIEHQVNRMNELIGEMLDLSRIQSGSLILNFSDNLNLLELIKRVAEQQQASTPNHKLQILADVSVENLVWQGQWDERRIEQVVGNLINNAIKYSPAGTTVEIGVKYKPEESAFLVWVRDEGHGINPEDLENIFQRYYRAQLEEGRRVDGLGLGLFISQQIIERHGGRIWAESEPGKGSTFYFSLPLQGGI
jgi:signal transduction histidine kinase